MGLMEIGYKDGWKYLRIMSHVRLCYSSVEPLDSVTTVLLG